MAPWSSALATALQHNLVAARRGGDAKARIKTSHERFHIVRAEAAADQNIACRGVLDDEFARAVAIKLSHDIAQREIYEFEPEALPGERLLDLSGREFADLQCRGLAMSDNRFLAR